MARNFLANRLLPAFVELLAGFGEVHGPKLTDDGVAVFGRMASHSELCLDYRRTLLPPKKYLLPPRETILTFTPSRGYTQTAQESSRIVLIGVHPCDLTGIAYLDQVFLGKETDPLYRERRNALTLVGLSCQPDEYCFCGDVGSDHPAGFDIFMRRADEGFYISAGSTKGKEINGRLYPLLTEKEEPETMSVSCSAIKNAIERAVAHQETFEGSQLWVDFANRCLSCGACSLCCPTCYCFDVREYGGLDGETAERMREWDNCLFKTHGEVAGSYNFRKTRQERFRYRFQHKYLGFGPTRGTLSCVGCGRCREVCPVRIDLMELFR